MNTKETKEAILAPEHFISEPWGTKIFQMSDVNLMRYVYKMGHKISPYVTSEWEGFPVDFDRMPYAFQQLLESVDNPDEIFLSAKQLSLFPGPFSINFSNDVSTDTELDYSVLFDRTALNYGFSTRQTKDGIVVAERGVLLQNVDGLRCVEHRIVRHPLDSTSYDPTTNQEVQDVFGLDVTFTYDRGKEPSLVAYQTLGHKGQQYEKFSFIGEDKILSLFTPDQSIQDSPVINHWIGNTILTG